ncbi:hypothetical protein Q4574_07530 [Aliiglaciecola sp. 3_MG-2023]|uniref:hypothetical protein n=1 Tax=Aliiglaciecola sp. 3_MG-2023 TaxID=3062644 RepID=UPI0026E45EB1|nr:hypothetical protein [Aliiglaciecola sp. 3_MG-2023]MDO6693131.1 hypothetical protein [Aliiglaciecola sp. 3_MG-2023]
MFFKKIVLSLVLVTVSCLSQATIIDFDDIATNGMVDDYYLSNGVQFQTYDWLATTGFGETSSPNFATSVSGVGFINFIEGFNNQLNFSYGAFANTVINIYDDLDGTGNLLDSVVLNANDISNFEFVSIDFAGLAHSVVLQGTPGTFAMDDLEFSYAQQVSSPPMFALLTLGVILLFARRCSSKR